MLLCAIYVIHPVFKRVGIWDMRVTRRRKRALAAVAATCIAIGLTSCGVGYDTGDEEGNALRRGEAKKVEAVIEDYHSAMSAPDGADWRRIRSDIACGSSALHKKAAAKIGGNQRGESDYPGGEWEMQEYTRITRTGSYNWRVEYKDTYHSRMTGNSVTKPRVASVYDTGDGLCINSVV